MLDIETIKKDFPIFDTYPNLSYLDTTATSQTPRCVLDSMEQYYTVYRANIHRGIYHMSEDASNSYENARKVSADFICAKKHEVIFTSGATGAMNMLAVSLEYTYDFKTGDEIVVSAMEHHSTLIPLQELARRKGMVLKKIPLNKDRRIDMDALNILITGKTKIVAITYASNVLGTINDVARVCEVARNNGAISIVDAAKAAGHIPIDVSMIGCDFLFFSGHKMCGPTGIGVLFGREKLLNTMHPGVFGGGAVSDVSFNTTEFADSPGRFEPGTPNIAGAIGIAESIKYVERIGISVIHEHVRSLVERTQESLKAISGVRVFAERDLEYNAGVVSFLIDGVHPHDVGDILSQNDIAVRTGHHCAKPLMKELGIGGTVRASFYIYNEIHDVDRLITGIRTVKSIFNV